MDVGNQQLRSHQQQYEQRMNTQTEQELTQERRDFLEDSQQAQEMIHQQPVLQQAPVQQLQDGQQQQMTRKEQNAQLRQQERERRRVERQRVQYQKNVAKARMQIDKAVDKIWKNQNSDVPGSDMTLSEDHACMKKVEQLERMIVTKVKDVRQATEYLLKLKELQDMAQVQDQYIQSIRMRTIQAPMYIQATTGKELPAEMLEAVREDTLKLQQSIAENPFQTEFDNLQKHIFSTDEEVRQAQQEDRQQVDAYEQRLSEIMEHSPGITRERARDQYLNEQLCPTLKNLERAREEDRAAVDAHSEAYNFLQYANEDLSAELRRDGREPLKPEEAEAMTREYLRDIMSQQNSFQIRVPNCDIMKRIISSGRFKTQMESVQSFGGVNDVEQRKAFTRRKFGVDGDTLPADMYEIYGYLSHGDLVEETNPNSLVGQGVGQYGQVIVKLKKERLRNRTTAVIGDSLTGINSSNAALQDRMDLQSVNGLQKQNVIVNAYRYLRAKKAGEDVSEFLNYEKALSSFEVSYTELQFHGQVTLDDIESVTLVANAQAATEGAVVEREMPEELQEMLQSLGIKAQIVKEDGLHEL